MAKSIRLLGATYSDVPAVDLPKTGGGTARFADIDETALVVTLSWDDEFGDDGGWVPDCTYAELEAAYNAGREITVQMDALPGDASADGSFVDGSFFYWTRQFVGEPGAGIIEQGYLLTDEGPTMLEEYSYIEPYFESVTRTYTPSAQQQTETITYNSAQGYNGIQEVEVTVEAVPAADEWTIEIMSDDQFVTQNNTRKWQVRPGLFIDVPGWIGGDHYGSYETFNAVASGTSVTPTESAQTIGGTRYMMEGAVTVNAIPSSYVGSGITRRDSTDLSASGATVSVPAGYYASSASKAVASGSVTASATKGSVSNHQVQITPSASVTAGYISSGATGTPVTVQASELVSGNLAITENGSNIDCSTYSTVSVNVSGGGSSSMQVGTKTATLSSAASSIQFTGLSGEPTSFVATSSTDQSTGGTKVVGVVYDGTSCHGIDLTTQAEADTGFTQSYSGGTLTITATTASFQANEYKLVYTYGGTAGNVYTEDAQVGSGATSITFTGLSDEPDYFSCIFKSTFSTSSGYQRVMEVVYDGSSTYGHALDSSAHALTSWTHSYSNGSLTITSTSTNNGGYFHQPGSYQLTAGIGGDQSLQTKTVTPTTSTQNVTADTGYTALKKVVVNPIPSQYIIPTGNIAITSNTASGQSLDVSQYATATVNVPTGGGSATVATKTTTLSAVGQTLTFSSLAGQPKMWAVRCTTQVSSSGSTTYYYVMDAVWDGSSVAGNCFRIGSTRRIQNITSGLSQSYSNGTLTITAGSSSGATPGQWYNGGYTLVYVY